KRDRQSLFQRIQSLEILASFAAHVSLSSHLQLSNNRPDTPVKIPRTQTRKLEKPISITANL
ncbi:hypothetical protein, partial [Rhizobium grahamii]|uniref:hypothetical protein n=1 Tax=Rhizobium grahamii TaxID=1120045 RepID=UPI001AECC81D